MRRAFSFVRQAPPSHIANRRFYFTGWPSAARLGLRSHPEKFGARYVRPLCIYEKPTLSRELSSGPGIHHRFRLVAAGNPVCSALPWHLFAVMRVESGTLAQLFGASFQQYSQAVPLFFPRLTPYRSAEGKIDFDGAFT